MAGKEPFKGDSKPMGQSKGNPAGGSMGGKGGGAPGGDAGRKPMQQKDPGRPDKGIGGTKKPGA